MTYTTVTDYRRAVTGPPARTTVHIAGPEYAS